jgi:uncharacterized coiled-coil DUF342 family protein
LTTLKERVELSAKEITALKEKNYLFEKIINEIREKEDQRSEKITSVGEETETLKDKIDELENSLSDLSTDCVKKDGIPEILKEIIQTMEDQLGVNMIQVSIKTKRL